MGLFDSSPSSLKFDLDEIRKMRTKIQNTSLDLANFKTTLLHEIDVLKTQWVTPAGKKFTQEVKTDWSPQVDQYITILNAVDQLLQVAENNYREVENAVGTINF